MEETKIVAITVTELLSLLKEVVREESKVLQSTMELTSLEDELWDRKTAAHFLGVSEQTVAKLVNEEKLLAQKSGRKYHFLKSSVMKFLRGKHPN